MLTDEEKQHLIQLKNAYEITKIKLNEIKQEIIKLNEKEKEFLYQTYGF